MTRNVHLPRLSYEETGARDVHVPGLSYSETQAGGPSDQNVNPTAIASAIAFGTLRVDLNVTPNAISSAIALGTPRIDFNLNPNAIGPTAAFGTLQVDFTIFPNGTTSALVFGTPVVSLGGDQNVNPNAITSALAFGTPRVDLNVTVNGIGTTGAFGTLRIDRNVNPNALGSTIAFGTPRIDLNVILNAIASSLAIGNPTVIKAIQDVFPIGVGPNTLLGLPTILLENLYTTFGPLTFKYSDTEIDPLVQTKDRINYIQWLQDQLRRAKRQIYRSGVVDSFEGTVSSPADTNDNTLISSIIPKETLRSAGKLVRLIIFGNTANISSNRTWKLNLNGVSVFTSSAVDHQNKPWRLVADILSISPGTQHIFTELTLFGATPPADKQAAFVQTNANPASDITLDFKLQSAVGSLGIVQVKSAEMLYLDRKFDG